MKALELEHGGPIPTDSLWVARSLLACLMEEQQNFGRVVEIALTTWRADEEGRWRTMEDVWGLA